MDIVRERYEIAIERIKEISTENISNLTKIFLIFFIANIFC